MSTRGLRVPVGCAALMALLAGCGQRQLGSNDASAPDAAIDAGRADGGSLTPVDAASDDTGTADAALPPIGPPVATPDPPPPIAIGDPVMLGEPLSFAFLAGYHEREQLWLLGERGALARVSTWDHGADYVETCGGSWSTGGYIGGRFKALRVDESGAYLLFTETLVCHDFGRERIRVLVHELTSGTTRVLLESDAKPLLLAGGGTALVILRRGERAFPRQPAPPGAVALYELSAGELRPIDVPQGGAIALVSDGGARIARWRDRVLLFVDGVPPLQKVDEGFERAALDALPASEEIDVVTTSPSGERLCVVTDRNEDWVFHSTGWVLQPDGAWLSASLERSQILDHCAFSPDETRVAFGAAVFEVEPDGLDPSPLATGSMIRVDGSWRGQLFGVDSQQQTVIALDWSTLEAKPVLAGGALPLPCGLIGGGQVYLRLPPDDRPVALAKRSCGCIDCDVSATFTWNVETGAVDIVEGPVGTHEVFGVAWLSDGGAVVLSTQSESGFGEDGVPRHPEPGRYFRVAADGVVATLGPLSGVEGVLHSPVVPPGTRTSAR